MGNSIELLRKRRTKVGDSLHTAGTPYPRVIIPSELVDNDCGNLLGGI